MPSGDSQAVALSRKSYIITVVNIKPFVFPNEDGNGTEWKGYCIDLIKQIAELLKFDYTIYEVDDGKYGTINDTTKEWDGMVRELIDRKADIALGPLSVSDGQEAFSAHPPPPGRSS